MVAAVPSSIPCAEEPMSAWLASMEALEMRRRFDEDEEEFEDDGFSFDDEEDEDEESEDEEDFEEEDFEEEFEDLPEEFDLDEEEER